MQQKTSGNTGSWEKEKINIVIFHCLCVLILKNKEQLTIWKNILIKKKKEIIGLYWLLLPIKRNPIYNWDIGACIIVSIKGKIMKISSCFLWCTSYFPLFPFYFIRNIFFCNPGIQTLGLIHTRQALCHWAVSPTPKIIF